VTTSLFDLWWVRMEPIRGASHHSSISVNIIVLYIH